MSRLSPVFVLCSVLVLCACSGPSETSGQSGPSAETDPEETGRTSAVTRYETFDASQYTARAPVEDIDVSHRVPDRLMQGRAAEGVQQTIDGYRIQVYSALDRKSAQEFQEQVREWWEEKRDEAAHSVFGGNLRLRIMYAQPYYRVRIGAFAEREAAEKALEFVQETYPRAFIARSPVTVSQ